jgi:hypothetical protein
MRIAANPDFRSKLDPDGPLHTAIEPGELYFVVEISDEDYRVVNNMGAPVLYPKCIFTVLDAAIPPGWQFTEYADHEYHLSPICASMPGFYESFFFSDGDISATNAARRTVREMLEATLLVVRVEDQRIIRRDLSRLTREISPVRGRPG